MLKEQQGATVVAFYKDQTAGTYHICGIRKNYTYNYPMHIVAFAGVEMIPDEEPVQKGVNYGDKVYLGIYLNNNVYTITPMDIEIMDGYGSWSPTAEIIAMPMTFYKVEKFDMNKTVIELLPPHYTIWLKTQCPEFTKDYVEHSFQANYVTHSIQSSPTIGKVKKYKFGNYKELQLYSISTKYAAGKYFEKEVASGEIYKTPYRWMYKIADADRERGYVSFRQYAERQPGCAMETDPHRIVKYDFRFINELPDDEQLEPPSYIPPTPPPPAGLEFTKVELDYDQLLYASPGDYVQAVVVGKYLHIIKILLKKMTESGYLVVLW